MNVNIFYYVIIFLVSLNSFANDKASSIFKKYSSSVVYIESKIGMGTGFFIEPNVILTNRHVVFGFDKESRKWNSPQRITLRSGKEISSYQFLVCSVNVDICIIGLDDNFKSSPSSIKFSNRPVKAGEDVYVIGHPHGVSMPIISTGIVSSEFATVPWDDIFGKNTKFLGFSTTAAISHGSSGSPVISKNGEVLGIAVGFLTDSQNLNLVISTNEINQFIKQVFAKDKKETMAFRRGFETELDSSIKPQKASINNDSENKVAIVASPTENSIPLPPRIESPVTNISPQGVSDNLPNNGSTMVAGVPVERIAVSIVDPAAIRRLLSENIPQFKSCYQQELEIQKNTEVPQGVLNIRFFIEGSGKVNRSEFKSEGITSDTFISCMRSALASIQFPNPVGGRTIEVNQPMNLFPRRI